MIQSLKPFWYGALLLIPIVSSRQAQAQNVVASAGGTASLGGNIINFTVGETIIQTIGTNPIFTQGFNQPSFGSIPLPVELMDFTGTVKDKSNILTWHTAMEKNNDHFDLERSADGAKYSRIASLDSKAPGGNSNYEIGYSYTDNSMTNTVYYYRLKQVDRDQRFVYSAVVKLQNKIDQFSLTVFPNPATEKATIQCSNTALVSSLNITDVSGKVIKTITLDKPETELDIHAFASGVYFISYLYDSQQKVIKLVKD